MKRRSFIGAVASLPLVNLLRIRPQIDLHRHLLKFIDSESLRFDLHDPFCLQGHAYATDARVMARIVTTAADYDDRKRKLPNNVLDIWASYWDRAEDRWRPIDPVEFVDADNCKYCPYCVGLRRDCEKCDGDGFVRNAPFSEHVTRCASCLGRGFFGDPACNYCDGLGITCKPTLQRVGDKLIDGHYFLRLSSIPGCEVNYAARCPESPILFRSDIGISGIVMPVYKP